ncbi:hypothetical protein [uncultured Amnibacterium sp.]|uniref:hypothetical protein n=1 Tax=uncultured Amnibacterium sp. TaxID=1631851 RepID=UPI0035CC3396
MSFPAAPAAPATDAPNTVVWAYRLYLVGAALSLIGIVVSLVLLPSTIDAALEATRRSLQGQDTQGIDIEGIARGAAIGGAVLGAAIAVAFSVLTFVFARKLRQGRNWARIVLAVFAGLQIFGVVGLYGLGALQFLIVAAAAVLSFLPASNAWFRSRKQVVAAPAV